MPAQHHAQDVFRAVESDRWAIRATNTGYSGIVDPHGRTLWLSGINTYEIHAETVYPRQTRTLYVRWGDWLVWLLLGGMGVSAIAIKYLDL
jgi:apolipoprotein N-acyltransferase